MSPSAFCRPTATCLAVCLLLASSGRAEPPAAVGASQPATLPGPTNVSTVYEQFLNVSGGNQNGDFVVRTPKSGQGTYTSLANRPGPDGTDARRRATAELTGSYDGASTFTVGLNAYGSREDGFKATTEGANVLASSRATFAFTVSQAAPYSLSGTFNSLINLPTGNSVADASVRLVNVDTGVATFGYDHQATTSGMPFNTSGTLEPGNYQLFGVSNFSNVTNAGGSSNGSASRNRLDFTFKVGQATPTRPGAAVTQR